MKDKANMRRAISTQTAAEIYDLSPGTLANLRLQKRGPRYFRCGRKVFYLVEDIEAWLLSNPVLTIDSVNQKK